MISVTVYQFNPTDSMPVFVPLKCHLCKDTIRGIMFQCAETHCDLDSLSGDKYACESCYREGKHPKSHLVKFYKRSCLPEVLTPSIASAICKCSAVTASKNIEELFPVNKEDAHLDNCGLLVLGQSIALAKAQSVLSGLGHRKLRKQIVSASVRTKTHGSRAQKLRKQATPAPVQTKTTPLSSSKNNAMRNVSPSSSSNGTIVEDKTPLDAKAAQEAISNSSIIHKRDRDVPTALKPIIDRFAFGNTHMALTFGPLVIENGVPG